MTTEILCRFDPRDQAPVVFLRDSINKDQIQVWNGSGNPKYMPLDYYRMTNPLSAADERVLMERFKAATGKQDQVVHISHRLPRTPRPLPNMLSTPSKQEEPRQSRRGKPIEAQNAPEAPQGDLPQGGEQPAPMPQTQPVAAPTAPVIESASASLFRRIQELNQRSADLNQKITSLNTEVQNTTTDLDATKVAIKELMTEFEAALEAEAVEELRKRKEMLAALAANLAPAVPETLAEAAQALHDNDTKPAEETTTKEAKQPRAGGRFTKAPAPAKH